MDKKLLPEIKMNNMDEASSGWILIAPIAASEDLKKRAAESKIIIPETTGESSRTSKGMVLIINEKCEFVKPGDKVLFLMYAVAEITIENDKFLAIQEKDIIAKYQ